MSLGSRLTNKASFQSRSPQMSAPRGLTEASAANDNTVSTGPNLSTHRKHSTAEHILQTQSRRVHPLTRIIEMYAEILSNYLIPASFAALQKVSAEMPTANVSNRRLMWEVRSDGER